MSTSRKPGEPGVYSEAHWISVMHEPKGRLKAPMINRALDPSSSSRSPSPAVVTSPTAGDQKSTLITDDAKAPDQVSATMDIGAKLSNYVIRYSRMAHFGIPESEQKGEKGEAVREVVKFFLQKEIKEAKEKGKELGIIFEFNAGDCNTDNSHTDLLFNTFKEFGVTPKDVAFLCFIGTGYGGPKKKEIQEYARDVLGYFVFEGDNTIPGEIISQRAKPAIKRTSSTPPVSAARGARRSKTSTPSSSSPAGTNDGESPVPASSEEEMGIPKPAQVASPLSRSKSATFAVVPGQGPTIDPDTTPPATPGPFSSPNTTFASKARPPKTPRSRGATPRPNQKGHNVSPTPHSGSPMAEPKLFGPASLSSTKSLDSLVDGLEREVGPLVEVPLSGTSSINSPTNAEVAGITEGREQQSPSSQASASPGLASPDPERRSRQDSPEPPFSPSDNPGQLTSSAPKALPRPQPVSPPKTVSQLSQPPKSGLLGARFTDRMKEESERVEESKKAKEEPASPERPKSPGRSKDSSG